MKKTYLSLIALLAGFVGAFITAGVHNLFFIFLPLLAFTLGYFSTWRWGLLNGFLLFISYTFAMSLLWTGGGPNLVYPLPYIAAFIAGGFSLLLIGALAPMVKRGLRKFGSIVSLVFLTVVVSWCGYSTLTHYGYYYQAVINSSENLENVELYLPIGAVNGEKYEDLYQQVYRVPGELTEDFTHEFVDTEYGPMLKLTLASLMKEDVPEPRYTGNIIFWQKIAPRQMMQLIPRYDVISLNAISWQQYFGPVKTAESLVVERFQIPLKIVSGKRAQIKLTLWNRTDRSEAVNFAYSKSNNYVELIKFEGITNGQWVLVPVEATNVMRISGVSD